MKHTGCPKCGTEPRVGATDRTAFCRKCCVVFPVQRVNEIRIREQETGLRYCHGCDDELEASQFYPGEVRLCIECSRRKSKEYYFKDELKRYGRHLENRYGISLADYDRILKEQDGVCAVCGRPEKAIVRRKGKLKTGLAKRLAVDHDHNYPDGHKPRVRGLLCSRCNSALGNMFDDPILIEKLLAYSLRCKAEKETT